MTRPVARLEAALALLRQPALDGLAVGHREVRDPELAERQLEAAGHLGDPARVQDRLALVGEERRHLGGRLQVEVVGLELHPAGRVEVVAGADAQQDVVGLGLGLVDVVEVVGHDQRQAGLRREPEELLVEPALLGQAVVLELEEEAVLAEDVAVLAGEVAGELPVVGLERPRDLAAETGRQPDQALAVPGEVLAVDPGLVVVAVEVGVGDQPAQVAVADVVLGQQDQVERLGVGLAFLVGHRPPGDVRLDADDRLDPLGGRRLVERDGAVERAVVGQGEAVEAVLGRRSTSSLIRPSPSSRLNSEWTWRCVKSFGAMVVTGPDMVAPRAARHGRHRPEAVHRLWRSRTSASISRSAPGRCHAFTSSIRRARVTRPGHRQSVTLTVVRDEVGTAAAAIVDLRMERQGARLQIQIERPPAGSEYPGDLLEAASPCRTNGASRTC